jgi:hypothetical protein
LKVAASQVAMHLHSDERRNLFASIDRLLDLEHWEDESSQISEASFRTFLRFTIFAHPRRQPNLGVSRDGTLLAAWRCAEKSIHVQFLAADQCIALIRSVSERGLERTAWQGHVARLRGRILANEALECIY